MRTSLTAADHKVMCTSTDKIYEVFGRQVREERLKKRMTQEQLAEYVDVSVDTIKRTESGQSVKLDIAYKISEILETPIQSLLPPQDHSPDNTRLKNIEINTKETLFKVDEILKRTKE